MAGGTSLPYGNVKNLFILSCTPTGTNVSATSVYIPGVTLATVGGVGGAIVTFLVPGVLPGDCVLDVNRPSNTVNGNTANTAPYVTVANAWVPAAGQVSVALANTSIGTNVTTPIEAYIVAIGRPDTTNPPTTTPTGIYS
jgi:hypothetical protein